MADFQTDRRPSVVVRLYLGLLAAGLASVFLTARWLQPDIRGYGTHEQLGLPACTFRQFLHLPCPHCGMTTSFSLIVRGQWGAAMAANPIGVPLAALFAAMMLWCLVVAVRGRWWGTQRPFHWLIVLAIGYLTLALVIWAAKIHELFFAQSISLPI
ncbi:MAG: DUF2752 domain-containing protein [Planctomycetaceae bacterium]